MYLRRAERRTKDWLVGYFQLAHNEWDPVAKQSKVRVLFRFGREDQLDRRAIVRLIGSLQRAVELDQAFEAGRRAGCGLWSLGWAGLGA
jgi:hypothetical protein